MEIWKPVNVKDYSDDYSISTTGDIFSIRRKITMKQFKRGGYLGITLLSKGINKTFYVHQLVALTFLELKRDGDVVNHLDGNKHNNNVDNLKWATLSENAKHAIDILGVPRKGKAVIQYDITGTFIAEYDSIKEAAKAVGSSVTKFDRLPKDYIWEKKNTVEYIPISEVNGIEIAKYPGYIISRDGKIFSTKTNNYLVQKLHPSGYFRVNVSNGKLRDVAIHTMVADAYLDHVPGKLQVNHKDRTKTNNNVENLEWTSGAENMQHVLATDTSHIHRKSVIQYTLNGVKIKTFNSIREASYSVGVDETGIIRSCKGVQRTSGGYIWQYNI